MKIRAVREIAAPIGAVRAALVDPDRWGEWVPGLVGATAVSRGQGRFEAELLLLGPRTFRARLEITLVEHTVRFGLLEGDASALKGAVRLEPAEGGCRVVWEMEIVFPLAVPGALMAEFEAVVPRWLAALERAMLAAEAAPSP